MNHNTCCSFFCVTSIYPKDLIVDHCHDPRSDMRILQTFAGTVGRVKPRSVRYCQASALPPESQSRPHAGTMGSSLVALQSLPPSTRLLQSNSCPGIPASWGILPPITWVPLLGPRPGAAGHDITGRTMDVWSRFRAGGRAELPHRAPAHVLRSNLMPRRALSLVTPPICAAQSAKPTLSNVTGQPAPWSWSGPSRQEIPMRTSASPATRVGWGGEDQNVIDRADWSVAWSRSHSPVACHDLGSRSRNATHSKQLLQLNLPVAANGSPQHQKYGLERRAARGIDSDSKHPRSLVARWSTNARARTNRSTQRACYKNPRRSGWTCKSFCGLSEDGWRQPWTCSFPPLASLSNTPTFRANCLHNAVGASTASGQTPCCQARPSCRHRSPHRRILSRQLRLRPPCNTSCLWEALATQQRFRVRDRQRKVGSDSCSWTRSCISALWTVVVVLFFTVLRDGGVVATWHNQRWAVCDQGNTRIATVRGTSPPPRNCKKKHNGTVEQKNLTTPRNVAQRSGGSIPTNILGECYWKVYFGFCLSSPANFVFLQKHVKPWEGQLCDHMYLPTHTSCPGIEFPPSASGRMHSPETSWKDSPPTRGRPGRRVWPRAAVPSSTVARVIEVWSRMTEELGGSELPHRWECLTVWGEALRDLVLPRDLGVALPPFANSFDSDPTPADGLTQARFDIFMHVPGNREVPLVSSLLTLRTLNLLHRTSVLYPQKCIICRSSDEFPVCEECVRYYLRLSCARRINASKDHRTLFLNLVFDDVRQFFRCCHVTLTFFFAFSPFTVFTLLALLTLWTAPFTVFTLLTLLTLFTCYLSPLTVYFWPFFLLFTKNLKKQKSKTIKQMNKSKTNEKLYI